MGRLGVAKDDVEMACKALVERGQSVTVANVRTELGTGSYTTLLPLIQEFLAQPKQANTSEKNATILPPTLSELGTRFVSELWAHATQLADSKIEETRREYDNRLKQATDSLKVREEELQQAFGDIKEMEAALDEMKRTLEEATRKITEQEGAASLLRQQLKDKDGEIQRQLERTVRAEEELKTRTKGSK